MVKNNIKIKIQCKNKQIKNRNNSGKSSCNHTNDSKNSVDKNIMKSTSKNNKTSNLKIKSKKKSNNKNNKSDMKIINKDVTSKLILAFAIILIIGNSIGVYEMAKLNGMISSQGDGGGNVSMCILGAPVISTIPDQSASIGRLFNYSVNCSQHCDERLEFYYLTIPTLSSFNINTSTGVISFTPQEGEEGTYDVYVYCDKAIFDTDSEHFELTIGSEYLGPEFLTGVLNEDNKSVDLNWSFVDNSDYYNIYYSTNISEIMTLNLDSIPPNVTKITNVSATNWTDYNASEVQKRYYTVSSVEGENEGLCQDIPVGKFTYDYTAPVSRTYGTMASNFIGLYLNVSYDAESFLQEIPGNLNPTMSRLEKSDSYGEYYKTHVRGLQDGNNFDLEISRGYLISVDENYNQTIVGKIYLPPYVITYTAPVSGTYGTMASNYIVIFDDDTPYNAESFLQGLPGNLNPTMSRLEKSDSYGEYYITHVRGLQDGNNFNMDLGISYLISVDEDYNQTQCINNSACFG